MRWKAKCLDRLVAAAHGLIVCGALTLTVNAQGAIDLEPGSKAPPLQLTAVDGQKIDVPRLNGSLQLIMFGDSSHRLVQQTTSRVGSVFGDPLLDGLEVQWLMILTDDSDPEQLLSLLDETAREHAVVVRDSERRAFEAYHVFAVPAIVVVDGDGNVVRAHAGPNPRIEHMILEDLLIGSHRSEPGRFSLGEEPDSPPDPAILRLKRMTRMAAQLVERGLFGPAEKAYTQVIADWPEDHDANTGLGEVLLATGRPAEAMARFKKALASRPDSAGAILGLAAAQLRGPEVDLNAMYARLSQIVDAHPAEPRAHFLLGMVLERSGDLSAAAASYKRSAALLLGPMFSEDTNSAPAP